LKAEVVSGRDAVNGYTNGAGFLGKVQQMIQGPWLFSRAEDLKSRTYPSLTWTDAANAQSLETLRDYVIGQAVAAEDWYLRKRVWKRRGGLLTRLLAMLCTAVGGAIPVLVQIFGDGGKPAFSPAWASIVLGMAAAFVGLDYFLGFTSGWMRYLQAQQKIAGIVEAFQFDWEALRAGWGGANPTREQVVAALARLKEIALQVEQVVEDETNAWIAEFKSTLKLLDDAARAKAEAVPRPGATVVVTNGAQVTGEWSLTVDDGAVTQHRGERAALVGLLPGAHKFVVEAQVGTDRKRDEVSAVIPPSGVAEVSLTLR
jgi:hypothetical protein